MTKISAQILAFDNQRFFKACINHILPFVDQVVILYSEKPWKYNPIAQNLYLNQLPKEEVLQFSSNPKVKIIDDVWNTEEEQRNAGLKTAKNSGMDYMLIIDPDEFYFPNDLTTNLNEMIDNPGFDYYRNPWHLYWKNDRNRILFKNEETGQISDINVSACFAINLKRNCWFENKRLPNTRNFKFLSGICHHMSYVFSDDEMKRKTETWSHHNDGMDLKAWYKIKWLGWSTKSKNISPINPMAWPGTIEYSSQPSLSLTFGFDNPSHQYIKPNPIHELIYESKAFLKFILKKNRKWVYSLLNPASEHPIPQ